MGDWDNREGDAELDQVQHAAGLEEAYDWPNEEPPADIPASIPDDHFAAGRGDAGDESWDDDDLVRPPHQPDDDEDLPREAAKPAQKSNMLFYGVAGVVSLAVASMLYFKVLAPPAAGPGSGSSPGFSSSAPPMSSSAPLSVPAPPASPVMPQMPSQAPVAAIQQQPQPAVHLPATVPGSTAINPLAMPAPEAAVSPAVALPGAAVPDWAVNGAVNGGVAVQGAIQASVPGRPGQGFELADGVVNRIADEVVARVEVQMRDDLRDLRESFAGEFRGINERIAQVARTVERLEKAPRGSGGPTAAPVRAQAPRGAEPAGHTILEVLSGWSLKGVSNGQAWIGNERTGVISVSPGDTIAGAGRVTEIERRSGQWVVVTTRGLIVTDGSAAPTAAGPGSVHVVARGETWGGLLQRYGKSAEQWYAANPGLRQQIDSKGWLFEGQRLTIPHV